MKKNLFFFALLASITASATVTITPLGVDYSTQKVTFSVSWTSASNNRIWVWIDLSPVAGTSPGTFAKAVISGATATAGSIDAATLNGRGVYVTTNPSTVTATLSNAGDKFNWCVYGSDAPPNVTAANGTYTLYGTPPFILTAAGGTATQTVDATIIATSAVTITPVTLTDETGCPGVFCIYTGTDLFIDADHICQQRASGAQNWEAWIQDTRDDEYYRIVLMPDNKWWLAQNMKYAGKGAAISGCTKDECGRSYTYAEAYTAIGTGTGGANNGNVRGICPPGWLLPVFDDWTNFATTISSDRNTVAIRIGPLNANCSSYPVNNYYGFSNIVGAVNGSKSTAWQGYKNDGSLPGRHNAIIAMRNCNSLLGYYNEMNISTERCQVRCYRQL